MALHFYRNKNGVKKKWVFGSLEEFGKILLQGNKYLLTMLFEK